MVAMNLDWQVYTGLLTLVVHYDKNFINLQVSSVGRCSKSNCNIHINIIVFTETIQAFR